MRVLPHDGETASIVRVKETGTFYSFNAGLVHTDMRASNAINVPSELARFYSLGLAPMLTQLRPWREHRPYMMLPPSSFGISSGMGAD
jgi:hypothetical protein